MRTLFFVLIVPVLGTVTAMPQEPSMAQPYDEPDAYQIYSVLLPQEESYEFANGTLVIQEETVSEKFDAKCLTPSTKRKFKDAIVEYERVNSKQRLLQPLFHSDKPYVLVSSDAIKAAFKEHYWDSFKSRYPGSGGYITLSQVGFNSDKTLAIVYTGSSCGGLCGKWGLHVLEKVDGKWRAVNGVTCFTVS
jgi:hypothetical protein